MPRARLPRLIRWRKCATCRALCSLYSNRACSTYKIANAQSSRMYLKADPEPKGRYRWVYNIIAQKLNKYIRKHKSLIPARVLSEADYVIYFNVVEFRRILYTYYPYGELFVIVKGSPEKLKPPRVVWRTKKMLFAEDAIGDLIKDLKILRGES